MIYGQMIPDSNHDLLIDIYHWKQIFNLFMSCIGHIIVLLDQNLSSEIVIFRALDSQCNSKRVLI